MCVPSPLVTIGITCYNDARYVTRCLESVFAQTHDNLEVIVVDDCSTDDSVAHIQKYGDRVRLIEHVRNSGGYMTGRKEVIAAATGEYVCHLDADDFLQPDFVERHVAAFAADQQLDWVAGNLIIVDAEGKQTDRWDYRDFPTDPLNGLRRGFLTASVPVPKNGLFSLRFLRENGLDWYQLPRTANGSDAFTCVKYLECNPKISLIPYYGLNYRIHGTNRCGNPVERIKMTVDLKEYYVERYSIMVYLPHPDLLRHQFGSEEYLAVKYYLLAVEFYRTMREFRVPEQFRSPRTDREIQANLGLFHEPIVRYAERSLSNSGRYERELTAVLLAIGHSPSGRKAPSVQGKPVTEEGGNRVPDWQRVVSEAPMSLEAHNGLAEAHYQAGELEQAQRHASAAMQIAPHDPHTLNTAGVVAFSSGMHAEAEVLFKRALAGDPEFADARYNLCELWGQVLHRFVPDAQRRRDLLKAVRWLSEYAPDPSRLALLRESTQLREDLLAAYKNRWQRMGLRVLLHRPSNGALKYLMDSWAEVLTYAGVQTRLINWGERTAPVFEQFRPDVFLTVADPNYMAQLDYEYIMQYRKNTGLLIGHITTFEHEFPSCDFLVTFHFDPSRNARMQVTETPLVSLPFAANPLQHYMRPGVEVWDYFFVGTNSPRKVACTKAYLLPLVRRYSGVLAGANWDMGLGELSVQEAAVLYNFARIYPNYSTPRHFDEYNEVNERTFIIPACGGFELMDNPVAIRELFTGEELAIADSPAQYREMFDHYLRHPEERLPIVRAGMRRVYREYTLFHVLERLVSQIGSLRTQGEPAPVWQNEPVMTARSRGITWADRFI